MGPRSTWDLSHSSLPHRSSQKAAETWVHKAHLGHKPCPDALIGRDPRFLIGSQPYLSQRKNQKVVCITGLHLAMVYCLLMPNPNNQAPSKGVLSIFMGEAILHPTSAVSQLQPLICLCSMSVLEFSQGIHWPSDPDLQYPDST